MILITSMGGCASTSFIGWASRKVNCNCPVNSEGIRAKGPGSNPKGLKHRISPPLQSDPYLFKQNSFNRTDITEGPIERAIFIYDTPYSMVLSLFRRRIAMGHAIAVTGNRPAHGNDLDRFLNQGQDTFGFYQQFENWTSTNCQYPRLLVNFNSMWENLDYILGYMQIDINPKNRLLRKNDRVNRMESLTNENKQKLISIYEPLNKKMNSYNGIHLID